MEKKIAKKIPLNFGAKKIWEKKFQKFLVLRELRPRNPGSWELRSSHSPPGAPPSGPRRFWIESPQSTGFRITLINVSESGSQKFVQNLSTKSTISQKIKIGKLFFHRFQTLCIYLDQKPIFATIEGGGGVVGDLHVINWNRAHFLNFLLIQRRNNYLKFSKKKSSFEAQHFQKNTILKNGHFWGRGAAYH